MIISKEEFKRLEKEGGGKFKALYSVAILEYGYSEIKIGTSLNIYIMNNGVFGDVVLGKKIYISYSIIKEVELSNNKLIIDIEEDNINKKIVFKIMSNQEKIYNTIRQNANLEYKEIERQSFKEKLKEELENTKNSNKENIDVKITERERIKQLKKENIPYCPKCHCTNLQYVENKKRLSIGRTILGGAVGSLIIPGGGIAGSVLGGLTSKKVKGKVKCLKCGHSWKI